ncbi:class I SAM-dependent methyltransferase [Qipengyuania flava]|jgi:SAM-dependent methyltransferase|uniref:class I SAM-dependent methyltransferase n=1 Tax=Qipengyuania flava TaxID=192812 RepID=UPI001C5895A8|nr:class I SAM-dependent methyltransferase [Qipengyuania flava]MBW3168726.1 class I SAM-dependent methyltransferase [Qipengyuania flava]MBY5965964.1 class I SAM-dependent methyltransferase [Qipengyuania flava]MBY6012288.1 class I SAM-dependent methyltransferase [Qipengyuania flava]MBY6026730.1 class I SAM-dependent methyltransferase [Qipengyuania flava]
MSADAATIAYYQASAPHYTLSFGQAPSRHLDAFLDRLAPGASVLELGCGAGRDSARIAERGFTLDATDGTPAMVRKANERFEIAARVMRFDELDAKETYDAVWAHACLLHVARADLPGVLASVHAALRENGLHFANYKLGIAEGRDPLGRLTNLPDEEWLELTYRAAGFAILATQRYRGKGADGIQRDWYALTLRKEAA